MGIYEREYVRKVDPEEAMIATFSNRVYGWMTVGLALTAAIALFVYASGLYVALMPFWWIWAFGTLGIAIAINATIQKSSVATMTGLFLAYAALEGLFFGTVLPGFAAAYGGGAIWSAFMTAALLFAVAMLYGIMTKSDLTRMGRLLSFALIGLIALTFAFFIMSFFMDVTWMNLVISYVGLVIFVGLTAYDAQQIRNFSYQCQGNTVAMRKLSLIMALKMYINVIMIFWYLIQIFANDRR